MHKSSLWRLVEGHRQEVIAFAQTLVRTPSRSGQEGDLAALVMSEMRRLDYDKVWVDEVGNVIGRIAGGDAPALMFNGHMDHVDAGDRASWRHPPMGGEIHDGELWGRGAADMKGALAAMVYAGGLAKHASVPLPGDLYVSAAVQEEVGGLGARHLSRSLPVPRVVIGEASGNQLCRGHRGRIELVLILQGRSVHASMPALGINPHFSMARFVGSMPSLEMPSHPDYGSSTVVPTRVSSTPESANVTPSQLHLVLDWRNIPGETRQDIVSRLETALRAALEPGCRGRVEVATKSLDSYTGASMTYADEFPSFTTEAGDPWLVRSRQTLERVLERSVEVGTWRFATDGGHFAAAGATVLGFGPGDDRVVHTVEERLPLDQLVESVVGYLALARLG